MSGDKKQLFVPAEAVTSPHDGLHAEGLCIGASVFSWDSGRHYRGLNPEGEAAGQAFLRAHGIDPPTFIIGNELVVRARCDGGLWLDTWRAVAGDEEGYMLCEYCPHCVRQERVTVPLVAKIPAALVVGAFVADEIGPGRGVVEEAGR